MPHWNQAGEMPAANCGSASPHPKAFSDQSILMTAYLLIYLPILQAGLFCNPFHKRSGRTFKRLKSLQKSGS
jgi:hypothetical protein